MNHKYFDVTQVRNGTLDITFSEEHLEKGKRIKLTTLNLNIEEADYIKSALDSWIKSQGV